MGLSETPLADYNMAKYLRSINPYIDEETLKIYDAQLMVGYVVPVEFGDLIEVNCDAAWKKESEKAGLGFAARDYNDEVLFLGARLDSYASSPLEAEAKAVYWAMTHTLGRGYSRVIFETDSLCLVKALHNKVILLQIASLFSDILSHSLAFDVCSWSFIKREGNRVAHSIASLALSCDDEITLDGSVPTCVNV
ncbi:reverse transcriptase [Tanacetum coccineum]